MDSTKVIKVKYGDTLRRFNALVDESEHLDLDMERLRAKVMSLFNFTHDADFTLTYIDEDSDVVTLVDDDDLLDAVRQNLNPLRINVLTDTEKAGRTYASSGSSTPMKPPQVQNPSPVVTAGVLADTERAGRTYASSGSSTPLKPPQVQNPLPVVTAGVAEVLKSVPDPLREALSKLSLELTSKPTSSAPMLSDLVESLSRIGQSYLNPNSQFQFGVDSGTQREPSQSPSTQFVAKDPEDSKDSGPVTEVLPDAKQVQSASKNTQDTSNECPLRPFSYRRIRPSKRGHNHGDNIHIFHRGVRCDGCGVHPITGPRYKSKVKEDYDLCSVCFAEMGNEADYIQMDRPASYFQPWPLKGLYNPPSICPPVPPHPLRGRMKPTRPKVDSRFIQDVNVMDGTITAPATPFTKIWRMRNNGTVVWPNGTQLVWIGGDRFSETDSVQIEAPANGVPVDMELDIAVDFKAPELPGRYISYWKMSLASGQKFGQRVWVLIQVVSSNDPLSDSFHGLNLNLPPDSSGSKGAEIIDVNVRPLVDGSLPDPWNPNTAAESIEQMISKRPIKDEELNFPINDTLLVGSGVPGTVPTKVPSSVSYPAVDFSDIPPVVPSYEPSLVKDAFTSSGKVDENTDVGQTLLVGSGVPDTVPTKVPSSASYPTVDFSDIPPVAPSYEPSLVKDALTSSGKVDENTDVEQTLLKELEEMGFKQVDLNKEVLRMNEYNLEQSVDDLCGVSEWDPILEDLEEMGFNDKEMNKELLKKNNGSIKRVVMDLIAGEKASGKEKTQ
ncbi:protein JOKA2 isoform X2 [Malania oleifera]|uniref:protein JOKA2 isoform X2 n=1 Tax=Malania oleifera TaxID=397392 RepID=UPI0025ADD1A7|nr:protein JOKA2 isoform X2 [Malania oleifera]